MKKYNWMLSVVLLLGLGFVGCEDATIIDDTTQVIQLNQEEINGLQYMVEEEKLARDVYTHFYKKYDLKVFNNISKSEQSHVDRIVVLLDKYEIENPTIPEDGKFSNTKLQGLYNDLITAGNASLIDALKVGATIEDVDIYDLDDYTAKVTQQDIIDTYDKLNCGSRNHMRAFTGQLSSNSSNYAAQFISQEDLEQIVNGDHEKCGH